MRPICEWNEARHDVAILGPSCILSLMKSVLMVMMVRDLEPSVPSKACWPAGVFAE